MKQPRQPGLSRVNAPAEAMRAVLSPITVEQLAHELNSLLDGASRCLRQAQRQLADASPSQSSASDDLQCASEIAQKLELAGASMVKMAELLERAMTDSDPDRNVLTSERPLGETVPNLIASLRPKASEHQVVFNLHMTNDAAAVPTGPLGTVLLNGLTNAIDACASSMNMPRIIELSIATNSRSELVVLISDTGPGMVEPARPSGSLNRSTKPGGHGIGLKLCRQIVDDLGGSMKLSNIPFGAGAIFQVRVPLPRLRAA